MSPRILSVYRLRAEDIVGSEENLYKLNFVGFCLLKLSKCILIYF